MKKNVRVIKGNAGTRLLYRALACLAAMIFCFIAEGQPRAAAASEPAFQDYRGKALPDNFALTENGIPEKIDIRGHRLTPAAYEAIRKHLPGCEILWTVPLGEYGWSCTSEAVRSDCLTEKDLTLMKYFPNLRQLDATGSDCFDALAAFAAEHPEIQVSYGVIIEGERYTGGEEWVDLSGRESVNTEELTDALRKLHNVTDVNLVGTPLMLEEKDALIAAFPGITFYWTTVVDGKTFFSTDTKVDFTTVNLRDAHELDALVGSFVRPEFVDVSTLGFGSIQMSALQEKYPDTCFAWLVSVGKYYVRTDAEVFNGVPSSGDRLLRNDDIVPLKYCTRLKAVNLSGQSLSDLSPLSELTELRILDVSGNKIKDLTPISGLRNLVYLNVYNNAVSDVSPLAALESLEDVNLMNNQIHDFSPLYGLKNLKRLFAAKNDVTDASSFAERFPNAEIDFVTTSLNLGWRNSDRYDLISLIWEARQMTDIGD